MSQSGPSIGTVAKDNKDNEDNNEGPQRNTTSREDCFAYVCVVFYVPHVKIFSYMFSTYPNQMMHNLGKRNDLDRRRIECDQKHESSYD